MKIGMVTEFYYPQPGGVSEHVRALSGELAALGHEVVIVTSSLRGAVPETGPRTLRLGRSISFPYNGSLSRITLDPALPGRFRRVLHEERFDLLHLHNPIMPSLPLLALHEAPCPMVATFHSYYVRDRWAELFRRPIRNLVDRLGIRIAVSLSAQRAVGRLFPADYRIIPNGVDCSLFYGPSGFSGGPGRPAAGPGSRGRFKPVQHLLFVGAMVRRKGLPDLIEAFLQLRRRRGDVVLWVVGDGPDAGNIQRLVPDALRDSVRFFGFVSRSHLVRLYREADVFCAPSLGQESFGMVLLEAMAAGLPVVASDIEGYRDVLTHGSEGLLVPPGRPATLASTLSSLLSSPEERSSFGRNGRAKAATHDWPEIARRVDSAYQEVSGLPGPVAHRMGSEKPCAGLVRDGLQQ